MGRIIRTMHMIGAWRFAAAAIFALTMALR
jgi:hypothetical protein